MDLQQALARIEELELHNRSDRVHWRDARNDVAAKAHNLLVDDMIPMLSTIIAILNKGRPELMGHAQNYAERALLRAQESVENFKADKGNRT